MKKSKKEPAEPTKAPNPVGRPPEYKIEYCELLIKHMKEGGSIESFGAVAHCAKMTIYNWFDMFPEFMYAKNIGEGHRAKFYEDMGKMIASGQLRKLKSEKPMLDKEGKLVLNPKTGEPLMIREYESATAGQAAWIFMCKNMLGWRDKRDVNVGGQSPTPENPTPTPVSVEVKSIEQKYAHLSDDELQRRYNELLSEAIEKEKAKKG